MLTQTAGGRAGSFPLLGLALNPIDRVQQYDGQQLTKLPLVNLSDFASACQQLTRPRRPGCPASDVSPGTLPRRPDCPASDVCPGTLLRRPDYLALDVSPGTLPRRPDYPASDVSPGTLPRRPDYPASDVSPGTLPRRPDCLASDASPALRVAAKPRSKPRLGRPSATRLRTQQSAQARNI